MTAFFKSFPLMVLALCFLCILTGGVACEENDSDLERHYSPANANNKLQQMVRDAAGRELHLWHRRLSPESFSLMGEVVRETGDGFTAGTPVSTMRHAGASTVHLGKSGNRIQQWKIPILSDGTSVFFMNAVSEGEEIRITGLSGIRSAMPMVRSSDGAPAAVYESPLNDEQTRMLIPAGTEAQHYSRWCWAAVMQSFLSAYGMSHRQCEIVEDAMALGAESLEWDCCENGMSFDTPDPCNRYNIITGNAGSVSDLLEYYGNAGVMRHDAPTFKEISAAVSENKLLIAQWLLLGASAHFVLINGVMVDDNGEQLVYYFDPWPGEGVSIATYEWMRGGESDEANFHVWMKTLVGGKGSEYSCDRPPESANCTEWESSANVYRYSSSDENEMSSTCALIQLRPPASGVWKILF